MKTDAATFQPYTIIIETEEEHNNLKNALNEVWNRYAIESEISSFDDLRTLINQH